MPHEGRRSVDRALSTSVSSIMNMCCIVSISIIISISVSILISITIITIYRALRGAPSSRRSGTGARPSARKKYIVCHVCVVCVALDC